MNFRDYATRIQEKAAAAAKKIPTFDDMAAKDEYIHSEEFRVRGQLRGKRDGVLKADQGPLATTLDPDETSSISSWSLLDRPNLRSAQLQQQKPDHDTTRIVKVETSNQGPTSQRWIDTVPMSSNTSLSSEAPSTYPIETTRTLSSSGLPVLSVVAKALETKDVKYKQTETTGSDETNSNTRTSDEESSESADEDDMNDPILSMIRKSRPTSQRVKSKGHRQKEAKSLNEHSSLTKSKQRFLHEINEEEVPLTSIDGMEAGLPSSASVESQPSGPAPSRIQGWFQRFASSSSAASLNRGLVSGQGPPSDVRPTKQPSTAPLTRPRIQKSTSNSSNVKPSVDDYHQADASAVLGTEELAQLAMMTNSNRSTCSVLGGFVQGHIRFAFIIFTLVLTWLVYYFQRSTDTVS